MVESATKAKIEAHMRKHRKSGGRTESAAKGVDEAEMDLKSKPMDYTADSKVPGEAEEMKAKKGGRVKRKHGGMAEKKEVGHAEGKMAHHHAGRRSRASGGSCESNPFTSAMHGTSPAGRKTMNESKGADH